jgi:hypothetical protein
MFWGRVNWIKADGPHDCRCWVTRDGVVVLSWKVEGLIVNRVVTFAMLMLAPRKVPTHAVFKYLNLKETVSVPNVCTEIHGKALEAFEVTLIVSGNAITSCGAVMLIVSPHWATPGDTAMSDSTVALPVMLNSPPTSMVTLTFTDGNEIFRGTTHRTIRSAIYMHCCAGRLPSQPRVPMIVDGRTGNAPVVASAASHRDCGSVTSNIAGDV